MVDLHYTANSFFFFFQNEDNVRGLMQMQIFIVKLEKLRELCLCETGSKAACISAMFDVSQADKNEQSRHNPCQFKNLQLCRDTIIGNLKK